MESALTSATDTICAISTPPGRGGIAIVRISGPDAISIADKLWHGKTLAEASSHTAHLGQLHTIDGEPIDQAVATIFCAPHSYTGENVVELSIHGSTYIQSLLVRSLCEAGCRIAAPGEFTRRAFENGQLDLPRAEAVADIIAASSAAAHRLAITQLNGHFSSKINELHDSLLNLASLLELELDFSEEDVTFADRSHLREIAVGTLSTIDTLTQSFATGDALRRGIPVAIVGQPNAGKSSLLNALLNSDRAIVSDIPGTTRDTVEETMDIGGLTFRFIDTAGLRDTTDTIENLGIERAMQKAAQARIVLWLVAVDGNPAEDTAIFQRLRNTLPTETLLIPCISKIDKGNVSSTEAIVRNMTDLPALPISINDSKSLQELRNKIEATVRADMTDNEDIIVTNARHHQALSQAAAALRRLINGLDTGLYTDLIAQNLRQAIHHLSTITGAITTDTILQSIFSTFCVGK